MTVCTKFAPLETLEIQLFPVDGDDKMSMETFSEAGSYPVLPGPDENLHFNDDAGMLDSDVDSDDNEEEDVEAAIAEKQPMAKSRIQRDLHSSTTTEGSPTASYQLMGEVLARINEARTKMALQTSDELSGLDQPHLTIPTSPTPPGLTAKPRRRPSTRHLRSSFGNPTVQQTETRPANETPPGSLTRDKITMQLTAIRPPAPKLARKTANTQRTSKRVMANLKRDFKASQPISAVTGKENEIGGLSALSDDEDAIIVDHGGGKEAGTVTRSMAIKVGKLDGGDMKRVRFR